MDEPSRRRGMLKKAVLLAVLGLALAAAGVAAAAAVTHQSSAAMSGTRGTVNLRKTKYGKVLVTKSGMTLYLFVKDRTKRSTCYGQCATYWPPLIKKGKLTAGTGVRKRLLGTTKRRNGQRQVTYKSHPLYRFKPDTKAGQTGGEGQNFFGGKWWVLNSAGRAVKKAQSPGTTTTPSTTYTTTSPYP
jgi:predicted lipoprotein with Yx(FWY)xxD motif